MKQKITLGCAYDICSAHQLSNPLFSVEKNKEVYGHCTQLHGHQYRIEIRLTGEVAHDTGLLINGYEVDRIVKEKVLLQLDHHFLNDLDFFKTHLPTAEWIAIWIFDQLKNEFPKNCQLALVRVYETPTLYAEYAE